MQNFKTLESFLKSSESAPQEGWKDDLEVCIPGPKSFVIQPSCYAHAVFTSKGPSLVTEWESGVSEDIDRSSVQTLQQE